MLIYVHLLLNDGIINPKRNITSFIMQHKFVKQMCRKQIHLFPCLSTLETLKMSFFCHGKNLIESIFFCYKHAKAHQEGVHFLHIFQEFLSRFPSSIFDQNLNRLCTHHHGKLIEFVFVLIDYL